MPTARTLYRSSSHARSRSRTHPLPHLIRPPIDLLIVHLKDRPRTKNLRIACRQLQLPPNTEPPHSHSAMLGCLNDMVSSSNRKQHRESNVLQRSRTYPSPYSTQPRFQWGSPMIARSTVTGSSDKRVPTRLRQPRRGQARWPPLGWRTWAIARAGSMLLHWRRWWAACCLLHAAYCMAQRAVCSRLLLIEHTGQSRELLCQGWDALYR